MLDPADPLPEDTNRDFLTDIRSNWLTSATSAEPKSGPTPARPRKPRPLIEADYLGAFKGGIQSIHQSVRGGVSSLVGMVSDSLRGNAKSGLLLGLLAAVMIVGALVYTVVVNLILNPNTVPDVAQAETSQALSAAQSPVEAYLPPVSAAGPANTPAASSSSSQDAAKAAGSIPTNDSAIPGLDQASVFDGAKVTDAANGAEISGQNQQRAGLGDDDAVTLAQAANTMAQKARDGQAIGAQSAMQPAHPVQAPVVSANATVASMERTSSGFRNSGGDSAANSAGASAYLDMVRAGQRALKGNDLQSAYKLAAQARALNPGNPAALELMQVLLAASEDPGEAQAAALDSIAHGGNAVFELQTVGAQPSSLHPARIVITATTLQFIPESAHNTGAFSIPLASITSIERGHNVPDPSGLSLLTIHFTDPKNGAGQLSFADASYRLGPSTAGRSQLSPSQQSGLLSAIRNVILTTKSHSRVVP